MKNYTKLVHQMFTKYLDSSGISQADSSTPGYTLEKDEQGYLIKEFTCDNEGNYICYLPFGATRRSAKEMYLSLEFGYYHT
jgi:hypothetical protein